LPKGGEYIIIADCLNKEFKHNIFSDSNEVVCDTFYTPRLMYYYGSKFRDCDSTAQGEIVDYYYNGNIRKIGTFVDGRPIDTLFSYCRTGELKQIYIHNDEFEKIDYYKSGQKKYERSSAHRLEISYYPSGQVSEYLHRASKGKFKRYFYYEDGALKQKAKRKRMKQYTNDGQLKAKLACRREFYPLDVFVFSKEERRAILPSSKYKWTSYDSTGQISRKVVFSSRRYSIDRIPLSIQGVEYIDYIIIYNKGKEVKRIEQRGYDHDGKYDLYKKIGRKWVMETTVTGLENAMLKELDFINE